ncbi:hypothetical protein STSP2_00803 [Anaerohalosphaera lusitana]|uniref:Uncharacterized protein n=1 Tax=Anaerohalosphaera lusitana TaxID=1936003 RepID=A0A1U9NIK3_9BACT|nr:hypothetical protein [Anaerohalosphaera lusitana]AQT67655.1 hypothetical protein STSP2_00803 [Anaerohalosphaera lusitana]
MPEQNNTRKLTKITITSRKQTILPVALILAITSTAHANSGTPLMWSSFLHLFFGNLFLGIFEGLLLVHFFKTKKNLAVILMILANYLSAWAGVFIIYDLIPTQSLGLSQVWPYFWKMVALTYILTLLLEYPFVALSFWRKPRWLPRSLKGTLIVQTISHFIIFGWYSLTSTANLYTDNQIVDLSEMSLPQHVTMYYISSDDGDVYSRSLTADAAPSKTFDLNSKGYGDYLFVRHSENNDGTYDLYACITSDKDYRDSETILIAESFTKTAAPTERDLEHDLEEYRTRYWFSPTDVPKLGPAQSSPWKFKTSIWSLMGLTAKNTKTEQSERVAFTTPFGGWLPKNATHLPTDKALFQLGIYPFNLKYLRGDQICIYDPNKKQLAKITHGKGPIAIIKDKPQKPTATPTNTTAD